MEDAEIEGADLTDMRQFVVAISSSPGIDSLKVDFDNFGVVGLAGMVIRELVIASSGADIVLAWDAVPCGLSYKVYVSSDSPEDPWLFLDTTADTTYTDVGAAAAYEKLFYSVTANNP